MVSIKTILAVCVSTMIAAGLAVSVQPDIKATITETGEKTMIVVENVGYTLLGKGEAAVESGGCDYPSVERGADATIKTDVNVGLNADVDIGVNADVDIGVNADVDIGVNADVDVGVNADVDVGVNADVDVGLNADVGVGVDTAGSADANTNVGVNVNADLESALDLSSKVQEATICLCGALGNK
jgi:hypothetical protein